jgi:hypothetical protein
MRDNKLRQPFDIVLCLLELEKRALLLPQLLQLGVNLVAQKLCDLLHLHLLLCHGLEGLVSSVFKHPRPSCFFDHRQNLLRLHVQHFGYAPLHNEKVGVVDVELDGLEQVLDRMLLRAMSVYEVLRGSAQDNLPSDGYLGIFFEANRRFGLVFVVKHDRDGGLRDTCLASFVDEVLASRSELISRHTYWVAQRTNLKVLSSDRAHVRDAENEANGIENVGFARAVQAGDRIETFVPAAT